MTRIGKCVFGLLLATALTLPAFAAAAPVPAGPPAATAPTSTVAAIQRRPLTADVAEYFFTVRVGTGLTTR